MVRLVTHFYGNVQGVGFRYAACSIARNFSVTGHVRNRPNGSVELVAEGNAEEIKRFLDTLRNRMSEHIDREETSEHPATGEFSRFEVR